MSRGKHICRVRRPAEGEVRLAVASQASRRPAPELGQRGRLGPGTPGCDPGGADTEPGSTNRRVEVERRASDGLVDEPRERRAPERVPGADPCRRRPRAAPRARGPRPRTTPGPG